MHSKAIRKMAQVKKLAGTKMEANINILTRAYIATLYGVCLQCLVNCCKD